MATRLRGLPVLGAGSVLAAFAAAALVAATPARADTESYLQKFTLLGSLLHAGIWN